ncbi:hypothetical protein EVAR_95631_1 [Eumeta japonica]|uniref:Uncharacterized protein n=1 Tax=Eumeta variegata TaxID=151549 RepID=A0A4C2A8A5_EUMVA|nr:hypothetical protein EVAR_95631_1 [Eumeta japonica]
MTCSKRLQTLTSEPPNMLSYLTYDQTCPNVLDVELKGANYHSIQTADSQGPEAHNVETLCKRKEVGQEKSIDESEHRSRVE